jgi:hypothetical protein
MTAQRSESKPYSKVLAIQSLLELVVFSWRTYAIEFMRLGEPPLAPIKQPSAFHVASLCAALSNTEMLAPNFKARVETDPQKADTKRDTNGVSPIRIE